MILAPLRGLTRQLRRFRRTEAGTATIEFALVIPVALLIFMASMESGLYMVRQTMMERGLDLSLRDFRLGRMASMNHDQIRDSICDRIPLIGNCRAELKVWMQPLDTETWKFNLNAVYCGDRNDPLRQPLTGQTDTGASHQLMLIRVCMLQNPIFPSTGFSLRLRADSATGDYELSTSTVVVNEPRGPGED